jgi:hypothetical protein
MKCRDCKKAIVLTGELTITEREQMEAHLKSCSDCLRYYTEVQLFSSIILQASSAKPTQVNPISLTDGIIRKVKQEPSYNNQLRWSFFEFLDYALTRYTLAGLSLCLIFLFVMEIGYSPVDLKKEPGINSYFITLESKTFRENFKKRDEKEKPFFLVSCIAEVTGKVDIKCLKSRLKTSNF